MMDSRDYLNRIDAMRDKAFDLSSEDKNGNVLLKSANLLAVLIKEKGHSKNLNFLVKSLAKERRLVYEWDKNRDKLLRDLVYRLSESVENTMTFICNRDEVEREIIGTQKDQSDTIGQAEATHDFDNFENEASLFNDLSDASGDEGKEVHKETQPATENSEGMEATDLSDSSFDQDSEELDESIEDEDDQPSMTKKKKKIIESSDSSFGEDSDDDDRAASNEVTVMEEDKQIEDIQTEASMKKKQDKSVECKHCGKSFQHKCYLVYHEKTHLENPDKFKCDQCDRSFLHKNQLTFHKKSHLPNFEKCKCEYCGKRFNQKGELNVHKRRMHPENAEPKFPYKCDICGKTNKSAEFLKEHKLIHESGDKPFKCDQCENSFKHKSHLTFHKKSHLPNAEIFKCDQCDKTYNQKSHLNYHKRIHLENVEQKYPYKCDECDKRFQNSQYLNVHKISHLAKDDPKRKNAFKCTECDKAYNNPTQLFYHKKSHKENVEEQMPFKCEACGKRFITAQNLKRHESVHLADDDPRKTRFECAICNYFTFHKSQLVVHTRTHKENEEDRFPFKCDQCPKRYISQHLLNKHMNGHLDDSDPRKKKYECEVCSKSYKDASGLSAHMKRHEENAEVTRPHKCSECGKGFITNTDLRRHKRLHLADDDPRRKRVECDVCGKWLSSSTILKEHKKTHLDDNDPEQNEKKRPFKCDLCEKRFTVKTTLIKHKDREHVIMLAGINAAYTKEEVLPVHTTVHQVDDGTIFYFKGSEPHRLHIKWAGKDVNAALPEGKIVHVFALDNAVYFTLESNQAYKAVADLDKITVTFLESVEATGLCKRMEFTYYDYVYRLCDREIPDGVPIDVQMIGFERARIHRGKLYYVKVNDQFENQLEMNLMGDRIIGFEIPQHIAGRSWGSYAREDSPYFHFSYQHHLHTFNVETREVFPMLVFGNMFNLQIKSVIDNIATLTGQCDGQTHLITAEFPPGYFEKGRPITTHDLPIATLKEAEQGLPGVYKAADHNTRAAPYVAPFTFNAPKVPTPNFGSTTLTFGSATKAEESKPMSLLDQRIKEMEKEFQSKEHSQKVQDEHAKFLDKKLNEIQFQAPEEETEEAKKRKQYEDDMSATLNQLIDQNFELTQQLEQLKKMNEQKDESSAEELAQLCERNEELTKINKRLEADNWEITQELDRIETENEELEMANAELIRETEELTKRKEEREKEMQATIDELEKKNAEIAEDIEQMKLANPDEETAELEKQIEMIMKMNEKLAKALADTADSSSGEEFEIIDNISE